MKKIDQGIYYCENTNFNVNAGRVVAVVWWAAEDWDSDPVCASLLLQPTMPPLIPPPIVCVACDAPIVSGLCTVGGVGMRHYKK